MRQNPREFMDAIATIPPDFSLCGKSFKRLALPEGLADALIPWYTLRSFYIEKEIPLSLCKSPELVDEIAAGCAALKPIYDYAMLCPPEEEDFL